MKVNIIFEQGISHKVSFMYLARKKIGTILFTFFNRIKTLNDVTEKKQKHKTTEMESIVTNTNSNLSETY